MAQGLDALTREELVELLEITAKDLIALDGTEGSAAYPSTQKRQAQLQVLSVMSGKQLTHSQWMRSSKAAAKPAYSSSPTLLQGWNSIPLRARAFCTRQSVMRKTSEPSSSRQISHSFASEVQRNLSIAIRALVRAHFQLA